MTEAANRILVRTTQMVTAYLGANAVAASAVPALIRDVHQSLSGLDRSLTGGDARGSRSLEPRQVTPPAVEARKSVFANHLICLEDGKSVTMLKRHLMNAHHLTPEQYREKWGLRKNYPMVAPNYAKKRSRLAKEFGLGKSR